MSNYDDDNQYYHQIDCAIFLSPDFGCDCDRCECGAPNIEHDCPAFPRMDTEDMMPVEPDDG